MKRVYTHIDLLIVVCAVLTPIFLLANIIDSDEYEKSGLGTVFGATIAGVITAYKTWVGRQ